jgi:predicted aminopeptidase
MPYPFRLFSATRLPGLIVIVTVGLLLGACSGLRYYAQAVRGQSELVFHRRSISALLADPSTSPALVARLTRAQQARRFASRQLGLPDNRSYTGYVDLHRKDVVWNVFAAPRYSIDPVLHCFPVAGCVAYRGYFSEAAARKELARVQAQGDDAEMGGVAAYSTLGWFADPILSSMLRWDDDELDGTIFHELAHQLIYVRDDTAFNESFATFVQDEGLREWRQSLGLAAQDNDAQAIENAFTERVLDLRARLKTLYASGLSTQAMEDGKQQEITAFRQRFAEWRNQVGPRAQVYDKWVAAPINNARLLPFGLYEQWTPAFASLFRQSNQQWALFYRHVRELARQPKTRRDARLARLQAPIQPSATESAHVP